MPKIKADLLEHRSGGRRVTSLVTDDATLHEGIAVFVPKKINSQFKEFLIMAKSALKLVNENRKFLGLEGIVVFNELLFRLDYENYVMISQVEIAKELGMQPANVSRAIRKLKELGFLIPGPKDGAHSSYRIHPELVWRGKAKHHVEAVRSVVPLRLIKGGKLKDDSGLGHCDMNDEL